MYHLSYIFFVAFYPGAVSTKSVEPRHEGSNYNDSLENSNYLKIFKNTLNFGIVHDDIDKIEGE